LALYAEHQDASLGFLATIDPRLSSLALMSIVRRLQGDHAGAESATREAVAWAASLDRPYEKALALTYASSSACAAGDFAEGERRARESIAISEAHGFIDEGLNARLNLAMAIGWQGRPAEAVAMIEPALEAQRANGHRLMVAFFIGQLATFHAALGRLERALSTIDAAIGQAVSCDDLYYLSGLHRTRAEILLKFPDADVDLVAADLRRAVAIAQSQGAAALEAQARSRLKRLLGRRESVVT
jgi:tetratricopeptide (TPR) repeat protein